MPALSPPAADSPFIHSSFNVARAENGTNAPIPIAGLALLIVALVLSVLALVAALIFKDPILRFATRFRRPIVKVHGKESGYIDGHPRQPPEKESSTVTLGQETTSLWPNDDKSGLEKELTNSPAATPSAAAEAALVALHPPAPAYIPHKPKNPTGLVRRNAISARRKSPPHTQPSPMSETPVSPLPSYTQRSPMSQVPVPPFPPFLLSSDEGVIPACFGAHGRGKMQAYGYPGWSLGGGQSGSLAPIPTPVPTPTRIPFDAREQEFWLGDNLGHPSIWTSTSAAPRDSSNHWPVPETTTAPLSMPCCKDWSDTIPFPERWCPHPVDRPHNSASRTGETLPPWRRCLDSGSASDALGAIDADPPSTGDSTHM